MASRIKVLSPIGKSVEKERAKASRLDTLEGKTVCEIWNGMFKGDVVFGIVDKMLKERYPGVKIITYSNFPETNFNAMAQERQGQTLEAVREELVKNRCDALITGMGA